jgi:hypothetical protein
MANGKPQISNGNENRLPLALCHLPFAVLSPPVRLQDCESLLTPCSGVGTLAKEQTAHIPE